LQFVAVRCSVLQCVAVRCSVLQCVAVCCRWRRPGATESISPVQLLDTMASRAFHRAVFCGSGKM